MVICDGTFCTNCGTKKSVQITGNRANSLLWSRFLRSFVIVCLRGVVKVQEDAWWETLRSILYMVQWSYQSKNPSIILSWSWTMDKNREQAPIKRYSRPTREKDFLIHCSDTFSVSSCKIIIRGKKFRSNILLSGALISNGLQLFILQMQFNQHLIFYVHRLDGGLAQDFSLNLHSRVY